MTPRGLIWYNGIVKKEIFIKYTGTTEGFEDYYGELLCDGKVITEYYYDPGRYIKVFKTRKLFNGK